MPNNHWIDSSIFYHIYPLGMCGAPQRNDFHTAPVPRLEQIHGWLDHLGWLGVNAVYLGPLFESSTHGYDTADYFQVDRRLGSQATLAELSSDLHRRGMRLILDGVFNHVGRDFWAFKDVQAHGQASPYCGWFQGLDFSGRSPYGDPFSYQTWNGHYELVKLNLRHPEVRRHLFQAIESWVRDYDLDGLRLDAADCLDLDFIQALSAACRDLKPDFWLLGEVIHGDYRGWAHPGGLDSVTNYEGYKGLYSSLAEGNYFEIAYALNRQFGESGLYRQLPLYNFVDNHDVHRVASLMPDRALLYPLYILLFSMPGVPAIYYGSEWGLAARKNDHSDGPLRPYLPQPLSDAQAPEPRLVETIAHLASLRRELPALRHGDYRQLLVNPLQLAFSRQAKGQTIVVCLNASDAAVEIELPFPGLENRRLVDHLNPGDSFPIQAGQARIEPLWPSWGRLMEIQ